MQTIIIHMSTSLLLKYFPDLTETQLKQFAKLETLYNEWNEKINVISRKDMESLYEKHILHSLGIAKVMEFAPGTKVLDIGTGGGFPEFLWLFCFLKQNLP